MNGYVVFWSYHVILAESDKLPVEPELYLFVNESELN